MVDGGESDTEIGWPAVPQAMDSRESGVAGIAGSTVKASGAVSHTSKRSYSESLSDSASGIQAPSSAKSRLRGRIK